MKLLRIAIDGQWIFAERYLGVDLLLLGPTGDQVQRSLNGFAQIVQLSLRLGGSGKIEQPLNGRLHAFDFVEDQVHFRCGNGGVAAAGRRVLQEQLHRSERISQFVRDAGGQPADCCQTLRAQHFLPCSLQLFAGLSQAINDKLHLLLNRRKVGAAANMHGSEVPRRGQQGVVQRDLNAGHTALQRASPSTSRWQFRLRALA